MILCKDPIDKIITKNEFTLPGTFETHKKDSEKKLVYSPAILNKIQAVIDYRNDLAKQLFATELFGVSQCLA